MIHNKSGKAVIQLFLLLIAVVFISALIILLVNKGILTVDSSGSQTEVLNTQFIPFAETGTVQIKNLEFCSEVESDFTCIFPTNYFALGEEIHFRYLVETSVYQGNIKLEQDYIIVTPSGETVLQVEDGNKYLSQNVNREKSTETILLKDTFILTRNLPAGEYKLEVEITNPFIATQDNVVGEFEVYDPDASVEYASEDEYVIFEKEVIDE